MTKYDKSIVVLLVSALAGTHMAVASGADERTAYLQTDFESGLPDAYRVYDQDGQTLHFSMQQAGFGETDSWRVLRETGTLNHYVASASKHKSVPGTAVQPASDWLVTPPVWLRGGDVKLTWRAMSVNEASRKGCSYKVYVSTTGDTPDDFVGEPCFAVDEESVNEWTEHSIDITGFDGKRIWIGIVHDSKSREILALDDIEVSGTMGLADIKLTPSGFALGGGKVTIGGTVTACTDAGVDRVELTCKADTVTSVCRMEGLGLAKGESASFEFDHTFELPYGSEFSYTVYATVDDVVYDPMEEKALVLAFLPHKRVLVEESTGMWCGYCPRGIVAMERMAEKYPDSYIGVAVHYNDRLAPKDEYATMAFPVGQPSGWVDRSIYVEEMLPLVNEEYTTLWGGLETHVMTRMAEVPVVSIDLATRLVGRKVTVDGTARFAIDMADADLRMVFIAMEDNIWGAGCYQNNYMSGAAYDLDGFEKLPNPITPNDTPDFAHMHVARAIFPSLNGVAGSIPAEIAAGESYDYTASTTLASDVNTENVRIVGAVIDAATGEVLNANIVRLGQSGIDDASEALAVSAFRTPHGWRIAGGDDLLTVTVYAPSGVVTASCTGVGAVDLTDAAGALRIVKVQSGKESKVFKLVF